ncbi:hypothetical protein TL16_g03942 [Triparma laevis f. inornata]|uniref:Uncharacterized protein n=2 Tax=Triparma laevis TaxID=1534972 RepID=A0A9W7DUS9_9STRA|nr:hypothetical protein TrLO_g4492 [Triparma laevis f. longispina]GMH64358.1 hypothetical protein TL16_g03942 [Triparma laevis f. inornata]
MSASPSGDGSKAPRSQPPLNSLRKLVRGKNTLSLVIILFLISTLYFLHTTPAPTTTKSTIAAAGNSNSIVIAGGNSNLESELSSCKLHLGLAERAAKSAVDSAARTNQVLESLAAEIKDPTQHAEILPCPSPPSCPDCPTSSRSPPCPTSPTITDLGLDRDNANGHMHAKKWLTVGMPTVPRKENHLGQTIDSWLKQLPLHEKDPLYDDVLLVVMNVHGGGHEWFEKAEEKYGGGRHEKSRYIKFIVLEKALEDPTHGRQDQGDANHPGSRVRKQTRDISSVLSHSSGLSDFYFFTEDDMLLCPNALQAIQYMMNKAERYKPNFMSIRASYGMNGIVIRDEDVQGFSEYLVQHQERRPPDHLVVEWFAGETPQSALVKSSRAHFAFRYNILHHLGIVSTLRNAKSKSFPKCFEELGEPTLFEVEAFDFRRCGNDDIWPCDVGEEVKSPNVGWGSMCDTSLCLNPKNPKRIG